MKNLAESTSTKAQKLESSPFHMGHHLINSLCRRMRLGQETKISPTRIYHYVQSTWKKQLLPYFLFEQNWIFPQIANPEDTQLLIRQHEKIQRMIQQQDFDLKTLNRLEEYLEKHVRFESNIQVKLSQSEMVEIKQHLPPVMMQNWTDKFWLINNTKD